MISPVFMHGETTLALNGTQPVNNDLSLLIKDRGSLYIDELRFRLISAAYPDNAAPIAAEAIRANISVGREQLTNPLRGGCPIPLLGHIRDHASELSLKTGVGIENNQISGAEDESSKFYVWKFRKPLYVEQGERLDMEFTYDGAIFPLGCDTGDVKVQVGVCARSLPSGMRRPTLRTIPYATHYVSDRRLSTGVPFLLRSQKNDLANPFPVDLRLDGFSMGFVGTTGAAAIWEGVDSWVNLLVRMVDNSGRIVIRDWTNFAHAFHAIEQRWNIEGTILGPQESFTLHSKMSAMTASSLVYMVGMLGDREVSYVP